MVNENKQPFELAVDKFLEQWGHKKDIVGAIICGSYVTGNPTKHSDIDLQILLDKKVKWRERGNKIVDGFLIEYFANPLPQNLKYYENDFKKNRKTNIHMFITGRVIIDKNGDAEKLIKKANELNKKKFLKPAKAIIESDKYHLWDMQDNLEEVYDSDAEEFYFVYYDFLKTIFESYSKFLGFEIIFANKIKRFLVNEKDKKKYNISEFPDQNFVDMYINAINLKSKQEMMQKYKQITSHVLSKMGGFNIDGWSLKTPIEK